MELIKDLGELFKKADPKDVKAICGGVFVVAIAKIAIEHVAPLITKP
jgi:hypothetical protein